MIEVACFGFSFYKIARLVNLDSNIRMDVYMHAKDFEMFKSEIQEGETWVHPIGTQVRKLQNLRKGRFWKELGVSADLYLLSEDAPLFAYPKRNAKTVFLPVGFDLTVQPFPAMAIKNSKTLIGKLKRFGIAVIQNLRIRSMDRIWASPFPVLALSLGKIRKDVVLKKFVPFPINYEAHSQNFTVGSNNDLLVSFDSKFLVFFPGRPMITKSKTDLLTGQTKGAEEALRGFLKFQATTCPSSLLILVDHSLSPDKERILQLISMLGIENLVVWIKSPVLSNRLTNTEMASLYQRCDVILGDFGSGWFGQTALEAAAHGKPFISHIAPKFMYEHFGFNPFTLARTPDEICQQLTELYLSREQRQLKALEMRKWYEDFLSEDVVRRWYQHEIRKAVW